MTHPPPDLSEAEAHALATALLTERLKAEHNWLKRADLPTLDLGSFTLVLLAMAAVTDELGRSAGDEGWDLLAKLKA